MGENSKIEWCHHTYNIWWGCQEVSPACDHCYARAMAHRLKPSLNLWGEGSQRLTLLGSDTSRKTLNAPLRWNRVAGERGERHRVFCSSMADVFDNYNKGALDEERDFLWTMIRKTPNLDWLLLTKRIGNVTRMMPPDIGKLPNVWLGISIVNQMEADRDIPKLLATQVGVRFLSCEPLLGAVDLTQWIGTADRQAICASTYTAKGESFTRCDITGLPCESIDWVIAGGESGPMARPPHPDWIRSLRDQCASTGVPYHFKQHGEWIEVAGDEKDSDGNSVVVEVGSHRAQREWHPRTDCLITLDGRVYQDPESLPDDTPARLMRRVGKKSAGRMLDGRVLDQFPVVQP